MFVKKDLFDIIAEISAVSNIVAGLSNQLGEDKDSLNARALESALFGVSSYLDRLADDLEEIDTSMGTVGVKE